MLRSDPWWCLGDLRWYKTSRLGSQLQKHVRPYLLCSLWSPLQKAFVPASHTTASSLPVHGTHICQHTLPTGAGPKEAFQDRIGTEVPSCQSISQPQTELSPLAGSPGCSHHGSPQGSPRGAHLHCQCALRTRPQSRSWPPEPQARPGSPGSHTGWR